MNNKNVTFSYSNVTVLSQGGSPCWGRDRFINKRPKRDGLPHREVMCLLLHVPELIKAELTNVRASSRHCWMIPDALVHVSGDAFKGCQ